MESIKGEFLPIGTALVDSVLGYAVVFIGLGLLMALIIVVGKIMVTSAQKAKEKATASIVSAPAGVPAAAAAEPAKAHKSVKLAPGSAGEVCIYDTDPRDAAMIMAIVADKLQKPLNELRFVSIKEVK